jgi:hypothetical protein
MADKLVWKREIRRDTGFAFDMKAGQSVRITAQTIIDFVCFSRDNLFTSRRHRGAHGSRESSGV